MVHPGRADSGTEATQKSVVALISHFVAFIACHCLLDLPRFRTMSNLEKEASVSLRAAILHYFQWLTAVRPGSVTTTSNTKGTKVLAALLEEFPELEMFASAPTLSVPELKVRFDSFPFHTTRLNYLENRVVLLEMVVQGTPGAPLYLPPLQGTLPAAAAQRWRPPPGWRPPAAAAHGLRPPAIMLPFPPSSAAKNKNVRPAVFPTPAAASKDPPSAATSTQPASGIPTSVGTRTTETTPSSRKRKNPPDATEKNFPPPAAASKQPPSAATSTQPASGITTTVGTTAVETTPSSRKRKNPPDAIEKSNDHSQQNKQKRAKKAAKKKKKDAVSWDERYEQMKQYHKDRGHCRIPEQYKHDPGLGRWVQSQRREYKAKNLSPERIARLEDLNFQWVSRERKSLKTWDEHFQDLKEFHRENGHTRVPRRTYQKNPYLGEWVHNQRSNYAKKSPLLFQTDNLKKLQEIGFEFRLYEDRKSWDERLEELVKFRQTHGHCNVPFPKEKRGNNMYTTVTTHKTVKQGDGETVVLRRTVDDEVTFANYVRTQKKNYWKYKNGDHKALTESRFKKLDDLGFGMESEKPSSLAPKSAPAES